MNQNSKLRTRRAMEARMNVVAELLGRGYTYKEIAEECQRRLLLVERPSVSAICNDAKRLRQEWLKERVKDIDELMAQELHAVNLVIKEAWRKWLDSCEDYTAKTQRQVGVPKADASVETIRAYMMSSEFRGDGNPYYLTVILKALEQRRKILGMDRMALDVRNQVSGSVEIRYVSAGNGIGVASSEREVMERDGLTEE